MSGVRLVAVKAAQFDETVSTKLLQFERTRPHHRQLLGGRLCVFCWHDDDWHRERGQRLNKQRASFLERDHEGVGVRCCPLVHWIQDGAVYPNALVAVKGGDHISRSHGLAIVKLNALTQLEGVGLAIGAHRHGFSQLQHRIHRLVAGDQRLVDVQSHIARRPRIGGVLIQTRHLGLKCINQVTAHSRASERLCLGIARSSSKNNGCAR